VTAAREPRRQVGRDRILAETTAAIAEDGWAKLTMSALGRRLGTTGSHVLYYFGSKDRLLIETLRWSEAELGERRRSLLADVGLTVDQRLRGYVDLYLPTGPGDPRWLLWLEVWSLARGAAEIRDSLVDLDRPWLEDLTALLAEADVTEPEAAARRTNALLDGLALRLVLGLPDLTRPAALTLAHLE
jgi:AcrR family transcriptional regulator